MKEAIQSIKQRLEIIGNDVKLNRAIEKAMRVAPTDISVLVTGESGVGKESIPKIIHILSNRKHNKYIAVNCGAIPEGTIDSELFGHEKGAFTGAVSTRNGYFEEACGGTIFLDEVGELPLTTQVRLLRVLENGEYIKVGSSKVQKTDVRIVAATNVSMHEAISAERFREDLYYRLSTVEINLPPLRERKGDIHLLFKKFASDFAHKYNMPAVRLDEDAVTLLCSSRWSGNIRQLRNVAEQLSILEEKRSINSNTLEGYIPDNFGSYLPFVKQRHDSDKENADFSTDREILYKLLFDMKNDLNDLKKLTLELMRYGDTDKVREENKNLITRIYEDDDSLKGADDEVKLIGVPKEIDYHRPDYQYTEEAEESLSLHKNELDLIIRALERNNGRRRAAAEELGISERTLYRKLKQYDLEK